MKIKVKNALMMSCVYFIGCCYRVDAPLPPLPTPWHGYPLKSRAAGDKVCFDQVVNVADFVRFRKGDGKICVQNRAL
jgi:hypothetical protein